MAHPLPSKPDAEICQPVNQSRSRPQSRTISPPSPTRPAGVTYNTTPVHQSTRFKSRTISPPSPTRPAGVTQRSIPIQQPPRPQSQTISPPSTSAPTDVTQKPVREKKAQEHKIPKKDPGQRTAFTKHFDKFRAEQRAASLPNGKSSSGTASPRVGTGPIASRSKASTRATPTLPTAPSTTNTAPAKSRDSSISDERAKKAAGTKGRAKRQLTPGNSESESSDEVPSPPRRLTAAQKLKAQKMPSPDYSSSTDEDSHRGRPAKRPSPSFTASSLDPTPASTSKSEVSTTDRERTTPATQPAPVTLSPPFKTSEEMRDRYEELYPAYEQLAQKLTVVYQDCESVEAIGAVHYDVEEIERLAKKWQKWHAELEQIRQWFDVDPQQ